METAIKNSLPRHIGIIMDGNGRWAKARGLPRTEGHKQGAKVFRDIATYCSELGIEVVTFYAFSTENWNRPKSEVEAIMNIFRDFFDELEKREKENEKMGFRIRFIGDESGLPEDIIPLMETTQARSENQSRTTVNIAVNYGGRQEIVAAAREIAKLAVEGKISPEEIDEALFAQYIYTAGQPDPDLIIRPSGEKRLSNFLTWQSAYSELYYSATLWPDFTRTDLDQAIDAFANRNRRFGNI